jgi:hypothetical protein
MHINQLRGGHCTVGKNAISLTIFFLYGRVQCGRVRERAKNGQIIYDAFNSFLLLFRLPPFMRHKRIFPLSFCLLLRNPDVWQFLCEERDFKIYCRARVCEGNLKLLLFKAIIRHS